MKKEIKFRGKDLNGEGWVYGSYVLTDDNKNNPYISSRRVKQKHQIVQYNAGDWGMGQWVYYDVDPETIGQFTGLKDKDGTEIYEGDIVIEDSYPMYSEGLCNYRCVVIWNAENAGFELEMYQVSDRVRGYAVPDSISEYEELEIIGNIHDKNEQKQALIDMMRGDEEIGLYDDSPKNH